MMTRWLTKMLVALMPLAALADGAGASEFLIRDGDRVVFYGDSITDSEWYPTIVESFVLTRFPAWRNHFSNRGVSGDNSGSIARFERDVIGQQPDFCTYNMGFNDGGYFAFSPAALQKWLANIETSVALARKADPQMRLVLLSPIPNEASVSVDPRWVSREVYPFALLSFGAEEARLAGWLGVPFIDLGLLYGQSMGLGKVVAGASFNLSRDGVHPQREGQAIIASHLLNGLGADPLVAATVIDAARARTLEARRCTIAKLAVADGAIAFTRTCESLPCPLPVEARPFAFLTRFDDTLNADTLAVRGLSAPAYTLFIDDQKIADLATAELAAGVNLSRYLQTPMTMQALRVMDAVRNKQVLEAAFFRQWIFAGKADGAGRPTDKADATDRTAMAAAQKAIVAAEAAAYALNTPKVHAFRLVPSTAKVGRFEFLAAADIGQPRLDVAIEPLAADWNRMAITGNELRVTLKNPGAASRSGTLRWRCGNGWIVAPAELPFTIEAGKTTQTHFAVTAPAGAALVPPPVLDLSWRWSADWAYPLTVSREVEFAPRLAIARATLQPTFSGKLEEWKDATVFALDNLYFINPAVPGKKLLWGGPADLSGKFFLKWDEAALYLAVRVSDDSHLQQADETMFWSQDAVIAAFLMPEAGKPDGRYEFAFGAHAGRGDVICRYWNSAKDAVGPDIRFASHANPQEGTILYEMALPWNRLAPFTQVAGKTFRGTFAVSDADSQPGKGFNYLAWTPGINYGKNPLDFAWITLGAEKQ